MEPQAQLEVQLPGFLLEDVQHTAAIVGIKAQAGLHIDTQMGQQAIFQSRRGEARELHAVTTQIAVIHLRLDDILYSVFMNGRAGTGLSEYLVQTIQKIVKNKS